MIKSELKSSGKNRGMVALSGDPITYGHIDLIQRAARMFPELIVAIGNNPGKQYLFSQAERVALTQGALSHIPNVQVVQSRGLLVDFANRLGVQHIVKGVRNTTDFEYEWQLHQIGGQLNFLGESCLLFSNPRFSHVSSSATKAVLIEQGDIRGFVPLHIKQALEYRLLGQTLVGVTGGIGTGKSHLVDRLCKYAQSQNIQCSSIDLDHLAHQLLFDVPSEYSDNIQRSVSELTNLPLGKRGLDRSKLSEIIFNCASTRQALNNIMVSPLFLALREALRGRRGIVLVEGALLAEADALSYFNNRILLTHCDEETQTSRVIARKKNRKQALIRIESQFCYQLKKRTINQQIEQGRCGKLDLVNTEKPLKEETLRKLITSLQKCPEGLLR